MAITIKYLKNFVLLSIIENIESKINEYEITLRSSAKLGYFNKGRTKTNKTILAKRNILFGIFLKVLTMFLFNLLAKIL